jgi:putative transcriptional regulator
MRARMADIFEGRSISTRFRILVEIASRQPSVQQKDVARELGITVQAVSERMKELVAAGLVVSRSRASYSVTPSGVDWLLRHARELQSYSERISRIVRDISVTAAVADADLAEGQRVALEMKEGVLHARPWHHGDPASGGVVSEAVVGRDVGITGIEGVIPLAAADVVLATLPAIQDGGSRRADTARLRLLAQRSGLVAAVGVESLVALRLAGIEPHCRWSSPAVVAEAASSGIPCVLVCSEADLPRVSERLGEAGVRFSVAYLSLSDADPL